MRLSNMTNTPWKASRNNKESSKHTDVLAPSSAWSQVYKPAENLECQAIVLYSYKNITNSIIALKMKFIMIVSVLFALCTADMVIHPKYCIVKNCYNCARVFNHNFGTKEQRYVCQSMLRQKGCCDFYNRKSKGILF